MRFQTTLEGAECLRRSDAGQQSVPGWNGCVTEQWQTGSLLTTSLPHHLMSAPLTSVEAERATSFTYFIINVT